MQATALLDVVGAAETLGVSVHTVRKWVQERRLPVTRIGRTVRFHPRALEELIEANTVRPKQAGTR
jgi:excisionase family DNA binding protein